MLKKITLADNTIEQSELDNLCLWLKQGHNLTKGPLCHEFEKAFSEWQGTKYSVFVNSGSSANLLMIQALKEGSYLRNNIVIAPAVSWVTTVSPLLQLGFDVKLCECDPNDLGLDIEHFEELCVKHHPSLVILVHVLGHSNQINQIKEICFEHNILLLEDSCEALGSQYSGKKLGSHGKAGSFSFYYGHHMSTIEGGMVITDDKNLFNLMKSIRSHGWGRDVPQQVHEQWKKNYDIDEFRDLYTFYYSGFNLRSTDVNAFLGLSQLNKIDSIVKKRAANYQLYSEQLAEFWHQTSDTETISSFAFATLVKNRLEVYKHMTNQNVEIRPLICGNIGLHPFWSKQKGLCSLPNADKIHHNGLYLPNHFNLSFKDIYRICESFKEIAKPFAI